MRGWYDFLPLPKIELHKSYLLSWRQQDNATLLEVDALLSIGHPMYELPRPAEGGCYRPAEIIFPNTTDISEAPTDTSSGLIQVFVELEEGRYSLEGEFGRITIMGDTPFFQFGRTIS
jgi:hypothetical protein